MTYKLRPPAGPGTPPDAHIAYDSDPPPVKEQDQIGLSEELFRKIVREELKRAIESYFPPKSPPWNFTF